MKVALWFAPDKISLVLVLHTCINGALSGEKQIKLSDGMSQSLG